MSTGQKPSASADADTETQCQKDGLLITRIQQFAYSQSVSFNGIHTSSASFNFPAHYRVQVDAEFQDGDDQAAIAINVHCQNKYGCQAFVVHKNSYWSIVRYKNSDASVEKTLARGYLPAPQKKMTLTVEVHNNLMTFSVNGMPVTTLSDMTFTTTHSLKLGLTDTTATFPVSALFSHFRYTPLPVSTTPSDYIDPLIARTPYLSDTPGFGCDPGTAQWQPSSMFSKTNSLTMTCQPDGLKLTTIGNNYDAGEIFYWLNGNFPDNYSVEASINEAELTKDGYAGLTVRSSDNGGYKVQIHPDGAWSILAYNRSNQQEVTLASGTVAQQPGYDTIFTATTTGLQLSINDTIIATLNDTTYTSTTLVVLIVKEPENVTGSALFSKFAFTPLA